MISNCNKTLLRYTLYHDINAKGYMCLLPIIILCDYNVNEHLTFNNFQFIKTYILNEWNKNLRKKN